MRSLEEVAIDVISSGYRLLQVVRLVASHDLPWSHSSVCMLMLLSGHCDTVAAA